MHATDEAAFTRRHVIAQCGLALKAKPAYMLHASNPLENMHVITLDACMQHSFASYIHAMQNSSLYAYPRPARLPL